MNKLTPKRKLFYRALAVFVVLSVVFVATAVNLVRIQLIDSEKYRQHAEENQLHDTEISAERDIIYDANGTVLAKSASVWKVYIRPNRIEDENFKNDLCRKLSEITGEELEDIKEKADKNKYAYLVVKRQVEFEEKEKIADLLNQYYAYSVIEENSDGTLQNAEKRIYEFKCSVCKRFWFCKIIPLTIITTNIL